MTTIKTKDLTGAALDWAVAESIEESITAHVNGNLKIVERHEEEPWPGADDGLMPYSPSTDWSQGGPLIEQFNIGVCPTDFEWVAQKDSTDMSCQCDGVGPTPLISACRAIVAAKLGDEVDVPEELV